MSNHVTTGWPNAGNKLRLPTMLQNSALKCCDRLAGAKLKGKQNPRNFFFFAMEKGFTNKSRPTSGPAFLCKFSCIYLDENIFVFLISQPVKAETVYYICYR